MHRSFAWWLSAALEHVGLRMTNPRQGLRSKAGAEARLDCGALRGAEAPLFRVTARPFHCTRPSDLLGELDAVCFAEEVPGLAVGVVDVGFAAAFGA